MKRALHIVIRAKNKARFPFSIFCPKCATYFCLSCQNGRTCCQNFAEFLFNFDEEFLGFCQSAVLAVYEVTPDAGRSTPGGRRPKV